MIHPDLIRTFLALVETKNFTRTAQRLNMTQPGVSQHIRKLEEHFQTELVRREGKSFVLTESGRRLVDYGTKLLGEYEAFKGSIAKDDPTQGKCLFTSPGSFGLVLFDTLIAMAQLHPAIEIGLTVAPNQAIPALLLERKVDVGFMTRLPEETELAAEKFGEEELLLIAPKGTKAHRLDDMIKLGFVDHPDGRFLAKRLLEPNFPSVSNPVSQIPTRVFINQINRILDPVTAGLGCTVLPEGAVRKHAAMDRLNVVRLKQKIFDPIYHVKRRDEPLPSRYKTVETALKKSIRR